MMYYVELNDGWPEIFQLGKLYAVSDDSSVTSESGYSYVFAGDNIQEGLLMEWDAQHAVLR